MNKNTLMKVIIFLPVIITLIGALVYFYIESNKLEFSTQLLENNNSFIKERLIFDDGGKNIYGLLVIPNSDKKVPAVIVLLAAAGTKESRAWYGNMFLDMGYATLILDQRGIGETDGYVPSIPQDYDSFRDTGTSFQSLFVTDVRKSVDVLLQIKEIDSKRIVVLGESMGGRYAIIAAAKDKRLKAAFVVSSAGYRGSYGDADFDRFIASINPNEYISKIAPRKVVMFHSDNDTVIALDDAKVTYSLANEPKELIIVKGCEHGYCDDMYERLKANLEAAFR